MSELKVTARFKIPGSNVAEFKSLARACMECVRDKDTGTLQYDWFFNEDGTECMVHETYASSDAVLEHVGNLGDLFGSLLGISELALEVFGAPTEELAAATSSLDVTVYGHFQSM